MANKQSPSVSVIIPAYNAAAYIAPALQSVFAQTYTDFEVIVVNDGSPDTEELETALEPFRAKITYIVQKNMGPSGARNTAIQAARGAYLAFLDSDDLWAPGYLSVQMRAFQTDPSVVLHYVDATLFGDSPLAGRTFMEVVPSVGAVTLESLLTLRCGVNTSCAIVRRDAVTEAGLFDEEMRYSEDFDLWVRLALRGQRIGYLRQILAFHRFHAGSLTATGVGLLHGQIRVYQKVAQSADIDISIRNIAAEQIRRAQAALALEEGRRLLMSGQFQEAHVALNTANVYYRNWKLRVAGIGLLVAPRALVWLYSAWRSILSIRPRSRKAVRLG